jgi:protease-4
VREVADDDDIKAVVVRVNSPGGSALASDIIWREMEILKAKKPVIVSMGSYAASGGYYISAPADAIVADRLTLTGSIGVFGILPNFGKALEDKVGVTFDEVSTNKHSGLGSGFKPLSSAEHKAMMQGVDRVYERFTSLVAEGRNLTIEKVLDIAEGRVWSGTQAQQIGLVDTCGGLNAAIAIAVDKAELGDNFQIIEHTTPLTGFMAMFQGINAKVRQAFIPENELGELYNEYKQMESIIGTKGIYTRCPYIYRF